MELEDWGDRWRQGRIGFHQSDVTDLLARHAERTWGATPLRRVLVPLCGKSLDMVFLADRADAVLGVEYVEQAVREFFDERGLAPEIGSGAPQRYAAGKYTLFAADFFAVTREHLGPVDAAFDRASLVALDAPTRTTYANHLRSVLGTGSRTLLVTFDYDQAEMSGPPFAVSNAEVQRLFEDGFTIEHLETRDALDSTKFRARGVTALTESAFTLTRQ